MQVLRREGGRLPVGHIADKTVNHLPQLVIALRLCAREDEKVLRTRKRHVVFTPEVEELRPLDRLERRAVEILVLENRIEIRPALSRRLRKRADYRDGKLQPLRLVNRHHRNAPGRDWLLVILKFLEPASYEEMQELDKQMPQIVLKPFRIQDIDRIDVFKLGK